MDGEDKSRREGILEKAALRLDLPVDAVAGLPRMELTGDREFRMENHNGILSYGREEIHIDGGRIVVQLRGRDLELKAMNGRELWITGYISQIGLL